MSTLALGEFTNLILAITMAAILLGVIAFASVAIYQMCKNS